MATLFDVDGENLDPGYKNLSRAEFAQDRELFHIYYARYPQVLVRPVALISPT